MSVSSSDEEEEDIHVSWEEWQEEELHFVSLVDQSRHASAKEAIEHDRSEHGVDLAAPSLDFYSRVRLINYMRSRVKGEPWPGGMPDASEYADDRFLSPVLEGDALLSWAPEEELLVEDQVECVEVDEELLEGLDLEQIKSVLL